MKRFTKLSYEIQILSGDKRRIYTSEELKSIAKQTLQLCGYTQVPDATFGDEDFIVIDRKRKEWCFWENGYLPFSGLESNYPENKTLTYWNRNRK
jgi:hypothetical protein